MTHETWTTGWSDRPHGLVVYDHKRALKVNNYLGRYYESIESGAEPIFFLTNTQLNVILRLYFKQRTKHV